MASTDLQDHELEDFITVVKVPPSGKSRPTYVVELRRFDTRQGDDFCVTQVSEPMGKIAAERLSLVWAEFHRLEIR